MSLKTRLKNLESAAHTENKDMCIFITTAYPTGQIKPPVIGYRSNDIKCMRFENESDDDLRARIKSAALEQAIRQDCGVKSALVFEIFDDD
jgi:hypothetical protein